MFLCHAYSLGRDIDAFHFSNTGGSTHPGTGIESPYGMSDDLKSQIVISKPLLGAEETLRVKMCETLASMKFIEQGERGL